MRPCFLTCTTISQKSYKKSFAQHHLFTQGQRPLKRRLASDQSRHAYRRGSRDTCPWLMNGNVLRHNPLFIGSSLWTQVKAVKINTDGNPEVRRNPLFIGSSLWTHRLHSQQGPARRSAGVVVIPFSSGQVFGLRSLMQSGLPGAQIQSRNPLFIGSSLWTKSKTAWTERHSRKRS